MTDNLKTVTRSLLMSALMCDEGVTKEVFDRLLELAEEVFGTPGAHVLAMYVDATDDCFYVAYHKAHAFTADVANLI